MSDDKPRLTAVPKPTAMTPGDAHRRLMEMEMERDELREPLPSFRTHHLAPRPAPDPEPTSIERAVDQLQRLENTPGPPRQGADRLRRRCTVVLSAIQLYKLVSLMQPDDTPSGWIRRAVTERIEREEQKRHE